MSDVDGLAKQIGACNTILPDGDGRLKGYNTDVAAIVVIESALGSSQSLEGKTFVVIGAGGAARAVGFAAYNRCA